MWDKTRGQIPFFPFIGEPSPGTTERPAIARSLTMELGQIAVSLMNRISERNWNITYSAKSINYILGIGGDEQSKVVEQQDLGSITIGVPPVVGPDGRVIVPSMWNSSAAALDATVFEKAIEGALAEAREIMVKQLTSVPESSGASKAGRVRGGHEPTPGPARRHPPAGDEHVSLLRQSPARR